MARSKQQILNTTSKWLNPTEARIILGVSAKNLSTTARRYNIGMKRRDGRSFVYSTAGLKKAVA